MHRNNFGNFYTREIYAIPIPIGFIHIPIPIMSRMAIPFPFPWDSHGNGIPMGFPTPMHTSTHGLREAYAEIYQLQLACILLTVPVSSGGCERAYGKLCLVKDELRSTGGDERLNSLMLMTVEKNI